MGGAEPESESDTFIRAGTARTAPTSFDLSSASSTGSSGSDIEDTAPGDFPAPQEA